ncbi:MAG: NAD(P)-dependent oxidoreductase [Nitrospirota bacterium]|nr:NAD(P)-dependent oxidoreductase [Nitrospirota bacterium]
MIETGFIGLGIMGSRMAANLIDAGHKLTVYNRSPEPARALEKAGAKRAGTPAEAARGRQVVVTVLSDPAAVRALALGPDGLLEGMDEGALWVDCSTVDPACSMELAALATAHGVRFIDAPVAGSKIPAEKGQLLFLVGGETDDLLEAAPLFEVMGKATVHAGPVGAGSALKLCNNLLLGAAMLGFAEALAAGDAFGLDPEVVLDALSGSPAAAPVLALKTGKIRNGDWSPEFPLKHMHKDLHLLMETAYEAGLPLPLAAALKERFGDARAAGFGNEDFCAVMKVARPGPSHRNIC